ncbi:MAG TPA: CaiB/BaiF CoA-transferase family protein [Streptosporangiaceae bacterium]
MRVVEFAGLAPAPFGCMILADLGADVLRVDRPGDTSTNPLGRGRRSVRVDLKNGAGLEAVRGLVDSADVLVEGFRPGVMERLGLGPEELTGRNPRLIYGRMTGWGQDGPMAQQAGHDINYISIAGSLHPIGPAGQPPVPPVNFLGDFGGGGLLLAMGVMAALYEREKSGRGQVIDAAMVDGAALIATFVHVLGAAGGWSPERGTNLLDGSAPFYTVYTTSDGQYMSVGALEPQFYAEFTRLLGVDGDGLPAQHDKDGWPKLRARFTEVFAQRTRDEWAEVFAGSDACVAPVLSPAEAHTHPHNTARGAFADVGGAVQPAAAPRFGRTPATTAGPAPAAGDGADAALADWGFSAEAIAALRDGGAIA